MTTKPTKQSEIKRAWHLIDAQGQILGRLSSVIATHLQGKNKTYYTPHLDCGDWVVVINAQDVLVTGKKRQQKVYYHHSGYPSGLKKLTFDQMMAKDPRRIIQLAVRGMLPKNKLRQQRIKRLRIYVGEEHPYEDKFKDKKPATQRTRRSPQNHGKKSQ